MPGQILIGVPDRFAKLHAMSCFFQVRPQLSRCSALHILLVRISLSSIRESSVKRLSFSSKLQCPGACLPHLQGSQKTMSGLEVLGAVASAVQLAQVSLAITLSLKSLISHIRDAKDVIQLRLQQIENLIAIANIISDKPHLQTTEIHGAVQRCLKEAETLKAALAGPADTAKRLKKLRHVFGGLAMENKIVEIMARLEREKSALVLCISTIDSYASSSKLSHGLINGNLMHLQKPLTWNYFPNLCHTHYYPGRFSGDKGRIAANQNSNGAT